MHSFTMVFIRVKKVKGFDYYYLVKSQWDSRRKISTQQTIKYLGKASDVNIENIPSEYQDDPKILSLLSSVTKAQESNIQIVKELREHVFESLKTGDIENIIKVAEEFKENRSLSAFYESILKPIMYEIGNLWQNKALDIGTEHVCSNMANKTIHKLTNLTKQRNNSEPIIICTPDGELHNIACNMLESVLLEKGYNVINISPSIPTESVIAQMRELNPLLVLLSVTLHDNIGSTLRLISRLTSIFQTPILLGGSAIDNCSDKERRNLELTSPKVTVIANSTLESIVKTIRTILRNTQTTNSHDQSQRVNKLMNIN
ncbi:MAG TPA: cobalamin-dependent protein [Candidatus Nitrosocosmicus sp.]|nr:cobalamin-dependent protein [Candidatus Nitrosocosmicus sp.]